MPQTNHSDDESIYTRVAVLTQRFDNLEEEVCEIKKCKLKFMEDTAKINREMLEQLTSINLRLEKQKGFYAGVVFIASGIIGVIAYIVEVFYHEISQLFSR